MGFEQLAALKEQLARQAKEARGNTDDKPARGNPDDKAARGNPDDKAARQRTPAAEGRKRPQPPQRKARPAPPVTPDLPLGAAIGRLQRRYPLAFPRQDSPKVPLKIGVLKDLQPHASALGLTDAQVQAAVAAWCQGQRYWASLTEGAARVDLAGGPAGTVTAQEAAWARQQAANARRARPQARKAAAADVPSPEGEAAPAEGASAATEGTSAAAEGESAPADR
jgi:ProP effector